MMDVSGSRRGFTLIELVIVVAIIAVIAAIAIPSLLRARRSGNEASAIESLRVVHSGQQLYHERDYDRDRRRNYARSLIILNSYELIDEVVASGTKSGYYFTMLQRSSFSSNPFGWDWSWAATAEPETVGGTGAFKFVVSEDGVIRRVAWDFEAEVYLYPWRPID